MNAGALGGFADAAATAGLRTDTTGRYPRSWLGNNAQDEPTGGIDRASMKRLLAEQRYLERGVQFGAQPLGRRAFPYAQLLRKRRCPGAAGALGGPS
jgi:hypothetical protein